MAFPTATALIDGAAGRFERAGLPNPELDAEVLFRGISGRSRASLLAGGGEPVSDALAATFEEVVARRERHEPVQYILGVAPFWRDEFRVNRAVLIPRPDTEVLVEAVSQRLRHLDHAEFLDLGTGSGAIALSVLRELPGARALAIDASEAALDVARENATRLGLVARVDIRLSHWFSEIRDDEIFDAVISNPPYIAPSDRTHLAPEVRDFEPGMALFAAVDDELSAYRAILGGLAGHLRPGGLLAFEVGCGQAESVAQLVRLAGLTSVETLKDLAGINRVVLARLV